MNVASPAKLNLFLHVVGQRPDGYHLLQSVFVLIDWCDHLHIEARPQRRIDWSAGNVAARDLPAHNLINRAAELLQRHTGCERGAHIEVHKHIPAQAGLGGGSGNAATVLLTLNHLWGLHLPRTELMALGAQLGADVPFFIQGGDAWVEGVGERITPMALGEQRFVVIKPPMGVATPTLFQSPLLRRDTPAVAMADFAQHNPSAQWTFGHNDLQAPAMAHCPDVGHALAWLAQHGLQGRMTGSGSAVFAPWPTADKALALPLNDLPSGWQGQICKKLNHHPVFDQILCL